MSLDPPDPMTIRDSPTLKSLIESYDEAVVFTEPNPGAFSLTKAFSRMKWSKGGLVLFGVDADGEIVGVDDSMIPILYSRFERLCAELTDLRVEIGTITFASWSIVFLVFNPVPRHTVPLEEYAGLTHDVISA